MHYCKQNQGAEIYFCLLFLFFPFSISHSKVINMEIFVKDFSGTTWPWILKFGTNIRYDMFLYKRISHIWLISCFICSFFFLFIPRHFKKVRGIMLYPPPKNCVQVSVRPSIRLSVCPSVHPSVRPSALGFHSLLGAFFNQFSSNLV